MNDSSGMDTPKPKTRFFAVLLPLFHLVACVAISLKAVDRNPWGYMFYVDFPAGIVSWLVGGLTSSFLLGFASVGTLWWYLLGKKAAVTFDRQKAALQKRGRIPSLSKAQIRRLHLLLPFLHICAVAAITCIGSEESLLNGPWKYLVFADFPLSFVLVAPLMFIDVPMPFVIGIFGVWGTLWWYFLGRGADFFIGRTYPNKEKLQIPQD